jgi:PAS domain S-box-containing protein
MKDPTDLPPDFMELRRQAEVRLEAEGTLPENLTPAEATRLIHELRVHQIELEMQNDELRRSQAELEESRSKYADLYDSAPVGYLTLDPRGKIVEANLTAATLLGVERGKLLGRFFSYFLVEADRRIFRQLINNVLNQTERGGEVHLRDGRGNLRVMFLDILFLTDAEGQDRRRVSLTDITELKRTQEELRLHKEDLEELVAQRTTELIEANKQLFQANEQLEALFRASPLAIAVFDTEGNVTKINPAAERLYGWTLEEVQGRLPLSIPKDSPEESLALLQRVLQGESVTGVEIKQQRKDGTLLVGSVSAAPLYDGMGKFRGFVGLAEDTTGRKLAEEARRESEGRYRSLVDLSPDAILVHSGGRYVFANPAGLKLFGAASVEDLLGRRVLELVHPDSHKTVRRRVDTGKRLDLREVKILRLDGRAVEVEVEVAGAPIIYYGQPAIQVVVRDITERKRAEQALRESEERLRLALEAAFMVSFEWDILRNEVRRFVSFDPALPPTEEQSPSTFEAVREVVHPEDRERFTGNVLTAIERHDGRYENEFRVVHPDGRVVWFYEFGYVERDDQGRPCRLIGLSQDITRRKAAEEDLRQVLAQAEEGALLLAALMEYVPEGITIADSAGRLRLVSRAGQELLGSPHAGMTVNEVVAHWAVYHPDGATPMAPDDLPLVRALRGEVILNAELIQVNEQGEKIFLLSNAAPLRDAEGSIVGSIVAWRDVTEHKQAEAALRESEMRFQSFMDNSPAVAWAKDEAGRYVYLNRTNEKRRGVRQEDWLGKTDFEIWPREVAEVFRKNDLKVLASGQAIEFVEETINPNGDLFFWWSCKFPFTDAAGARYVGGIGLDITGQKAANESIRRLTHELMRVQEQERRKIALELHDTVAQELAALKIGLENLRRSPQATSGEEVSCQVAVLLKLLKQSLTSIRTLSYNLRPPDLEHLGLEKALQMHCEEVAARTGLMIDFCSAGIDSAHLNYEVAINLYRIIQEGLANVARHAWAENVSIRLVASHPKIILRLEDDGQGFEVSKTMAPGRVDRGMGLSGMRERVAVLGGEMEVSSRRGHGTRIKIEIPWRGDSHGAEEKDSHR